MSSSGSTSPDALAVGVPVQRAGYFTKRHCLGDLANAAELERRIGFAPGRLTAGWYVLFMVDRPPTAREFELGGYTHFSGSRQRGHTASPGESAEEWLHAHAIDILRQREKVAANFTVTGPERLTKIVPVTRTGVYWHPQPNPIPQWRLFDESPMRFVVHAFHKP
ncbi:hypothetical protein [Aquabacterium humicola]|uniref:hypothetical protein n=1 Tax=Aquabacterium humicola TaxID=3237377 RepID=UPI0025436F0B|nr:hypothetical protein [Rubrivivax pictus]